MKIDIKIFQRFQMQPAKNLNINGRVVFASSFYSQSIMASSVSR